MSVRVSAVAPFIHGVIDPAAPDGGQDGIVTDGPGPAPDAVTSTDARDSGDGNSPVDAAAADALAPPEGDPGSDAAREAGPAPLDSAGRRDADAIVDAGGDGRPAPAPASGCGCHSGEGSPPRGSAVGGLFLALAAAATTRRRKLAP